MPDSSNPSAARDLAARRQIEAGHPFRQQVDAYWKLCEQWADADLHQTPAASAHAAKKKALYPRTGSARIV